MWVFWRERKGDVCVGNEDERSNEDSDGSDSSCHRSVISLCAGRCPEHATLPHSLSALMTEETEAEVGCMTWPTWHLNPHQLFASASPCFTWWCVYHSLSSVYPRLTSVPLWDESAKQVLCAHLSHRGQRRGPQRTVLLQNTAHT